ncbi:hypothetical protein FYJ24_06980 [Actinomycetaceae bacterium WB03_NA08]|uniref:Uncharacterized protein n=1 Tax=Scrofimicrobium canadense TaxID=2652290 RepID=A0A6N7W519_9ACTO|nr:hypothetical protein [Scrofimicrobium canadense]MSS84511.1 hypothetical protein [Scrofimicrobium canadense]
MADIDIPDEAVEAATQVFWDEVLGRSDKWEQFAKDDPDAAEIIRDNRRCILEAAAPIIRADERRRVAEEIRAAAWPPDKAKTEGLDFGYALGRSAGLDIAAQIAERSGK